MAQSYLTTFDPPHEDLVHMQFLECVWAFGFGPDTYFYKHIFYMLTKSQHHYYF